MISTITNTMKWISNKENRTSIFILATIASSLLFLNECKNKKRLEEELLLKENNLVALQDTVRSEKLKNGEIQLIKTVLISDLNSLKELNNDLYKEVKNQKTQVFYLSKITSEIKDRIGGISTGTHQYDPVSGKDIINWNFDTSGTGWSRKVEGFTTFQVASDCNGYKITPIKSQLQKVDYKFTLTTGLKKSEKHPGSLEIFIDSNYPEMTFTDIEGSIIEPSEFKKYLSPEKPKKWSFGPYVGIGYGITLENTPRLAPVIGVGLGLQYKILSF